MPGGLLRDAWGHVRGALLDEDPEDDNFVGLAWAAREFRSVGGSSRLETLTGCTGIQHEAMRRRNIKYKPGKEESRAKRLREVRWYPSDGRETAEALVWVRPC
jgi:hypothetical protein